MLDISAALFPAGMSPSVILIGKKKPLNTRKCSDLRIHLIKPLTKTFFRMDYRSTNQRPTYFDETYRDSLSKYLRCQLKKYG